jgi:hypothetical protein
MEFSTIVEVIEFSTIVEVIVLKIAIRNICIAFLTMVDIRRDCLVATNQNSHASDSGHTVQV